MPAPVSKKQMRMMYAIANGGKGKPKRGGPGPDKSVAQSYANANNSAPAEEDKGKAYEGGRHPAGSGRHPHGLKGSRSKEERKKTDKKKKESVKKSDTEFGAGIIVVNDKGQVLLGRQTDNKWSTFGGSVDAHERSHDAAIRELKEEIGLKAEKLYEINPQSGCDTSNTFVCEQWTGTPKVDKREFKSYKWFDIHDIPWGKLRYCSKEPLRQFTYKQLHKSKRLKDMLYLEDLQKNILRSNAGSEVVHDVTHGDALKLVGNGVFRMLRNAVKDMVDEDFRELKVDTYTLFIRKHCNDVYSGRINDGNKQVHQFTNKSLPAVSVELMSVFEWYLPEDAQELEIVDDLHDSDINGGMQKLIDDYYKHNIINIYQEMENIRAEIRQSHAVDIQQVEQKIMKLFDKLESTVLQHADKHNTLVSDAGSHIDEVHEKLKELQLKIDELNQKPTEVEAVSRDPRNPGNPTQVHEESYMYLTKPQIEIEPGGKMRILFKSDWTYMDQSNYLKDLRARALKKIKQ